MLTKRQKEILEFVESYGIKNGYSPSMENIRKGLNFASVSTVHFHILKLEDGGYVEKLKNRARSLSVTNKQSLVRIPLLGSIAAGEPIEAVQEYETIPIPKNLLAKSGEHFALRVNGDSMIQEGIFDGDTVIVRKQDNAEDGDTVVALINQNEVTLKKIYKMNGGFKLQPANPTMSAFVVKHLIVQGKVVSVTRSYVGRKALNQTSHLLIFNNELRQLARKIQEEIRRTFKHNSEYEIWQRTEDMPNQDKFFIETGYTLLNEMLLLWVCKDKKLLRFECIKNIKQLASLKQEAQQIYSHIFEHTIFCWYVPSDFLLQEISHFFNRYDFTSIDRDILGRVYEQFITREERKKLGQFYTPEPVIDYILDQTGYTSGIGNKKIIDISCGSGGFTTRAANRLINQLKVNSDAIEIIKKVIDNIYGLDINPFACYIAETNMLIQLLDIIVLAKKEHPAFIVPKINIFRTNTMGTTNLFNKDEQAIKDIKNKTGKFSDGFDFVVGNPPYLEAKKMDKKTKELCIETCPNIASGAFDIFVCFIDKGLHLLNKNGALGYIFPNKFLIAHYAKKMREVLLNDYTIKEIIDVSECDIFENVSVYPVIFIAENRRPRSTMIKTAEKIRNTKELEDKSFTINKIKQDTYKRDDFVFFILPSDQNQSALLTKLLAERYKTLNHYLTMKWTLSFHAAGLREKFLFPQKPNSKNAKKLIGGKSFAGNSDIDRYKLMWGGWWIDYDEALAKKHHNQLPPRSLFEREKIIICQNALRLRAAYDSQGFYCKDTFFVSYLNERVQTDFNLKFFLALLNSKLLHYYYANIYKSTHVAGGYLHYLVCYLNSLPVAEPTERQHKEIVDLVEKIINTKDSETFKKIDKKIDNLIYRLYDLTSQEIEIVDASTAHLAKNE